MKKLLPLVLILVLALAILAPAQASACKYDKAAYALATSIANNANATVKSMVRMAQLSWIDDAKATEFAANSLLVAKKLQIKALGFDVNCTWDTYVVDGHKILIDPLHVIKPLPPEPVKKK